MMRRLVGMLRSLVVYWRPGRQRGLRRLYAPFIAEGDLVFDVGAHLGDRSAAFAALGARVVALEPQPHVARWLRRIVARTEAITVREAAVGRTPGTARMAVSGAHPTVSTLAHEWREKLPARNASFRHVRWEDTIEVPVTTLDALITEFGMPRFCKIDVEGHEADVLAGLSQPIAALSVEFVAGTVDVVEACVARLEALATYRYNVVVGEGRAYRFTSWVAPDEALAWLAAGADGVSSGDLYARLESGA